ncbi:MAG: hypothetical protein EOP33_02540 [Rickettsiaceae bacterium]|nr:MAG: hypothetical protein EOP33_02540 [Rickettsiaceae bacterium]
MPQFETSIYYSQLFWLAIIFGFLYIIVRKFVVPSASKIINNRKHNINTSLEAAQLYTTEAKDLSAQVNESIKEANIMAQKIITDTVSSTKVLFDDQKTLIDKELKEKSVESIKELEHIKKEFLNEQSEACVDLAKYIIEQITCKDVDMQILTECYRRAK